MWGGGRKKVGRKVFPSRVLTRCRNTVLSFELVCATGEATGEEGEYEGERYGWVTGVSEVSHVQKEKRNRAAGGEKVIGLLPARLLRQ